MPGVQRHSKEFKKTSKQKEDLFVLKSYNVEYESRGFVSL
jgi:hypothetical protein